MIFENTLPLLCKLQACLVFHYRLCYCILLYFVEFLKSIQYNIAVAGENQTSDVCQLMWGGCLTHSSWMATLGKGKR